MLSVPEALNLVLERARSLSPATVSLRDAQGLILAEEITSDVDSPPHDKAMVDGYAVRTADFSNAAFSNGAVELAILEEVVAGDVPSRTITSGTSSRVMTGAPIPDGADAMVMVEKTELLGERVRILAGPIRAGQNIMRRGTSMKSGDVVLKPPAELRPCEIGVLAEVGRAKVSVVPRVKVAVLSTGNELVPCDQIPGPGQIRNSNGPLLLAAIQRANATPVELGIARDYRDELHRLISLGLQTADVVILSGGVSAGVLDLVPGVLAELGVKKVFHKVQLKPGKPIWFGSRADESKGGREQLVFGLPGNPVSCLVCFELFVRPAVERMSGRSSDHSPSEKNLSAKLSESFQHRGDRPTYHPAQWLESTEEAAIPLVKPLRWHGSADLRALSQANALICFPAGDKDYLPDQIVRVRSLK